MIFVHSNKVRHFHSEAKAMCITIQNLWIDDDHSNMIVMEGDEKCINENDSFTRAHMLSIPFTSFLLIYCTTSFQIGLFLLFNSMCSFLLFVQSSRTCVLLTTMEDQSHERIAYLNKKRIVFSLVHFISRFCGISDVFGVRMREHEKLNGE